MVLLGGCFLREAPEGAIGSDRRAGKWGLTFGYLRFTDTRANKVFVTLECLYGFAPAKTDALKRIVKP